jgi:hypothetical protein
LLSPRVGNESGGRNVDAWCGSRVYKPYIFVSAAARFEVGGLKEAESEDFSM